MTQLVRLNQKKWGSGLKSKSRLKEGTELVLPRGATAEAVAATVTPRGSQKVTASYLAAENETPAR